VRTVADSEPTKRLAERLVSVGSRPSKDSTDIAQKAFIDTFACMLAGSSSDPTRFIAGAVQTGPSLESPIVGMGTRATAADAALIGGTAAHALELDDYTLISSGHPSAVLVPALLAVGARLDCQGSDLLDAYAIGYEATLFLGSFLRPPHHFAGFVPCAFGAAAAASTLLGADVEEMRTSLGIVASLCVELRANFGTATKPLMCGRASSAGVLASQLAHAGMDASTSILEAPGGLLTACEPASREVVDAALLHLEAGEFAPSISTPTLKKFASCGGTHSGIEAALRLRPQIGSSPIESIVMEGPEYYQTSLRFHQPTTIAEAKFSAEASIAVALVDGSAGISQFTDESLARPEVRALMSKTSLISSAHLDRVFDEEQTLPAGVTIKTADCVATSEVLFPPGTSQLPMSLGDVFEKLEDCATFAQEKINVTELADELRSLNAATSLGRLQDLLLGN
jgi:aconitate decarboxylase